MSGSGGWQNVAVIAGSAIVIEGRQVDRARVAAICARYGVAELAVFGSFARGDSNAASDVDLLYTLAPGQRLGFAINRLEDELAELFGRRVDLVARNAVHPMLRDQIEAQAHTVYAA